MVMIVEYLPYFAADSTCDITIDPTNQNQYIVWGVGGLGETAFKHFTRAECKCFVYVCIFVCVQQYLFV